MGNCWSRFRIMLDCWPRFVSSESTSPRHSGSTQSSPPTIEPSNPSSEHSVGSSPLMDPSQHCPVDSVRSSPVMEPYHRSSVDSVRSSPPPIDAVESIREMYKKIVTVEQIDRLMSFVENHLQKMNIPSEAESSSSDGWLETVRDDTRLAARTIHTISTEAEKLSNSDAVKAIGSVALKVVKGVGELHWVVIGLSVAAHAIENYLSVDSTEKECREILLNILELAKDVNQHSQRMSYEREKLCNAVGSIVEGAVIFCDYLKKGNIFRCAQIIALSFPVKILKPISLHN